MKKRFLTAVVLMLAVLAGSTMLAAQEKAPAEKEKAACHKDMTLTAEQKAKVEELKTSQRLKTIDLKADLEKLQIMLKREMMKPEPNAQELEGIVKKMSAAREKLQMAHIEHMLAMRKLLGPDWRALMGQGAGAGCGAMQGPGAMEGCEMMEGPAAMGGGCMMGQGGLGCMMHQSEGGCMMHEGRKPGAARQRGMMHAQRSRMAGREGCCGMRAPMSCGMEGCCEQGRTLARMGEGCGMGERRMVRIEKSVHGGCMGDMAGKGPMSCMGEKSCGGTCSKAGGSWNYKMFRPFGKKAGHSCSGDCRGMGEMKGCKGQEACPRRIEVKVIEKE